MFISNTHNTLYFQENIYSPFFFTALYKSKYLIFTISKKKKLIKS